MRSPHRPPHIFQPHTLYFLSAKTIEGAQFFNSDKKKRLFLITIKNCLTKHHYQLYAFVIHDNHYHILFRAEETLRLSQFIKDIHANSARRINELDSTPGRQVWYQYWDRCIRNERDFWYRFNYIHHNPVKHGYCRTQEEVESYPWCSFGQWIEKNGREWAYSVFERYPSRDFTLEHED